MGMFTKAGNMISNVYNKSSSVVSLLILQTQGEAEGLNM